MKKFKLFFILALAFVQLGTAQNFDIKPGNLQFSAGLGLISTFAADKTTTLVPPISAKLDYYLSENFALGLYAAYTEVEGENIYEAAGVKESFHTSMQVYGLRATAMSNDLNNWRIYGGFMTGYSLPTVQKTNSLLDPDQTRDDDLPSFSRTPKNSMIFSGYVGAQRAVSQRLAIYGEAGFGISLLNLGLTFNL